MKYRAMVMLLALLSGCEPIGKPANFQPPAKPPAAVEDDITVYFSPDGGGMAALLNEINNASQSIDVQAYLVTAMEIVHALDVAQKRGVHVRVILDKNNPGGIYSAVAYFSKTNLPVWRDGHHKDAHDKVMLIDGRTIITGSFNFTDASDDRNVENLLIIRNKPKLFAAYQAHFNEHLQHSDPPK